MVIIINKRFRVFLDECIINLYLLVYVCIHQWINKSKLYIDKIMSIAKNEHLNHNPTA